jgi:hypothetical protein
VAVSELSMVARQRATATRIREFLLLACRPMTAKPHDALFKAAFEAPEHAAGVFRSLLPPTVEGALAWDTVRHEPGSFIDPDLADRHSDLLFSIEVRETRAYLYLLLEHQSTNDDDMPLRMLIYLVRIWERYRKQHKKGPLPLIIPAMIATRPGAGPRRSHLKTFLIPTRHRSPVWRSWSPASHCCSRISSTSATTN